MNNIKVTLSKSKIGSTKRQKKTVQALGLKKVGSYKTHEETMAIKGMIDKVSHLVSIEVVKK